MKTKAAVLVGIGKPLEIQELDVPSLQEGQCLVRIVAAGICRTQLNEQAGLNGEDPYIPHLLGHEAAGWVEDIGLGVERVKAGDYVVVSWIKGGGADVGGGKYVNTSGEVVQAGGAAVFTEYAIVSENRVTRISREVPGEVAALLGCAVPTGVGVIWNTLDLQRGQCVAVFGIGGVGGAAILGAKARGCDPIIAIDIVDDKLSIAKQLGATHGLLNTSHDVIERVKEIVPQGVDAAVEATGLTQVGELAFEAINKRGVLAFTGHPGRGAKVSLDPFMFIEGRSVVGSWGGDVVPEVDIAQYVEIYLQGGLPIDELITHRFDLDKVNEALGVLKAGQAGRIILNF